MTALQTAKRELRQLIRKTLADVPADAVTSQTSNVAKALLSTPEYEAARRLSIYLSMPRGEISTNAIVRDALSQHKKVFVPYTRRVPDATAGQPGSVMDMVSLQSIEDYESLQPDSWGIPTPSKESLEGRENCLEEMGGVRADLSKTGLDLVVMPGMAFDEDLNRLGHGKGFYDYFLRRYQDSTLGSAKEVKMPFLVGLALKEQVLHYDQKVPTDTSDWPLDSLIVGDGTSLRAADSSSS
ncbi:MAG: hypothetical protein M1812_003005 [Candelaria pacifica]|nr:MAG: hypothetical protein M1812_003005 [Candelaria pacifica]